MPWRWRSRTTWISSSSVSSLPQSDAELQRAKGGGTLRGLNFTLFETPAGVGGPFSPLVTNAATRGGRQRHVGGYQRARAQRIGRGADQPFDAGRRRAIQRNPGSGDGSGRHRAGELGAHFPARGQLWRIRHQCTYIKHGQYQRRNSAGLFDRRAGGIEPCERLPVLERDRGALLLLHGVHPGIELDPAAAARFRPQPEPPLHSDRRQ